MLTWLACFQRSVKWDSFIRLVSCAIWGRAVETVRQNGNGAGRDRNRKKPKHITKTRGNGGCTLICNQAQGTKGA